MTPAQRQRIKAEYVMLGAYYQQPIHDAAVALYAEDLADLDCDSVIDAMRQIRRQPGRRTCPLPADIREMLHASVSVTSQANEIAGKISGAISRYGHTRTEEAHASIGEVGWLVVARMGGWRHICSTLLSSEMGTFRAQCRDMARAELEYQHAHNATLRSLPMPDSTPREQLSEMSSVGDVVATLLPLARCR